MRRPRWLLSSLAVIALLATSSPVAAATPPLQVCDYKDVLTPLRAASQYPITIADTHYTLGSSYAPTDLVSTANAGLNSGYLIRNVTIADLKAMAAAAKAAGAPVQVQSAYRSYATQVSTFNYWVSVAGYAQALATSARPGHSEHQMGIAIDFKSYGGSAPWNYADWATTKAGAWMKANAWKYGWVMSYPKGTKAITCYDYEPWHYRFVGRSEALAIHSSLLTPRQWLWNHDTAMALVVTNTYSPMAKISFVAGSYTGYKFDALGAIVATKTYKLARSSSAAASRRVTVYGVPYALVYNGVWAGYYVRLSSAVVLH